MKLPFLPPIDLFSFGLGFGVAVALGFVLFLFRKQIFRGRDVLLARLKNVREALTSGTERNLRQDIVRVAQTAHLGGNLFALDEVLLAPRLLIPEPDPDPSLPPPDEDDVANIIPRLPDWPELAATYRAPTLSAAEALSGEGHVVILGIVGSGKSTLLAHLASRAALEDETGLFKNATPILIHAADLNVTGEQPDILQPIIGAAQMRASVVMAPQLPRHLRRRLKEGQCVIFMDGFDELPPARITDIGAWLEKFLKAHPQHRLIAAAQAWGHGPLLNLGFAPIHIAPWNADDYRALIQKWNAAWQKLVGRKKKPSPADVDPHIIMGWLGNGNEGRSIFEITLKVWGALAGDARGNRPVDWLEMYIQRAGLNPAGTKALGRVAAHAIAQENGGLPRMDLAALLDPLLKSPDGKPAEDTDDYLDKLIAKRVLVKLASDRLAFRFGLAEAYCAATGLAASPDQVKPSQNPGWNRALAYFAALGDLTPHVAQRLTQTADLLQTDLLTCARWLRDAPANAKWRGEIYKRLSQLLANKNLPESLRLRVLSAFASAHDPTVAQLFKQALASPEPFLRRMAALGLGTFTDPALVPSLATLFADPYLDVRWASALALAINGSEKALDAVIQGLTSGDDDLRRACGQALARNGLEGHNLLREAAGHSDLSTRRAAVYGLADTKADWAYEILKKMEQNEQEWFVRSAATEILEQRKKGPQDLTPRAYLPPELQGWLVAWAAQQGTGVPPGKAAVEVLNRAMTTGDTRTRQAAAEAIGRLGDPGLARDLYNLMRDPDLLIRDAAFRALAQVSTAVGQRLAMSN